ncbi:FAD binding domain-containing protein [Thozetella sp. PMI_491]|nr:FAD binding domain-containing protein [Thozetella sp. PMI_491]
MRFANLGATLAALALATPARSQTTNCRCLPSDSCWPSTSAWSALNATVNGQLVATVPIGSVCHAPNYDSAACTALQNSWTAPQTHIASSSSLMQTYFANQSCDPFTSTSSACELGNYVSYAVNVTSAADVAAALAFASDNNIRVVVRNTGHDFFGRSTGAGALAIWTHYLKDTSIVDWSDDLYTGKALRMGAGILGYEAVEAANAEGLVVVTGECPTVGIAGGFTQGGGHSALSTSFGLGADQALEFEVVTAAGEVVTANAQNNTDLFWALSGGGGGTYGVVTALTVRAHPDLQVGGATLTLVALSTTQANFIKAVTAFHSMIPNMTDHGASVVYVIGAGFLLINPITVYNSTGDYVKETVLGPFLSLLSQLSIPVSASYSTLSYRDHYNTYMGPLPYGHVAVEAYQFGSRLIPRETLEDNNDAFVGTLLNLTAAGITAAGSSANYALQYSGVTNAVLPAWRNATVHLQITTPWNSTAPWSDMTAAQARMTNEFVPMLEKVAPDSGVYLNEGDFRTANWQDDFFGENYAELLSIKQKWDPNSLFYGLKSVGSDAWTVGDDGRMCKA